MELEQFVEQDIAAFLDKRIKQHSPTVPETQTPHREGVLTPEELNVYAPGRDYQTELEQLLHDRNYEQGQQLILGFKEHINEYPEESPERLEGNRLLETLYKTYQDALHKDPAAQETLLQHDLAGIAPPTDMPISGAAGAPNATADGLVPGEATEASPDTAGPPGMTEQEERELVADIAEVEAQISRGEYRDAIGAYRAIKERLTEDRLRQQERRRYFPKMSALYQQIHEGLLTVPPEAEQGDNHTKKHRKTNAEREREHHHKSVARRFRYHLNAAKAASKAGEVAEAMLQYHALHPLYAELPKEQRDVAQPVLLELHKDISAQQHQLEPPALEEQEQELSGRP